MSMDRVAWSQGGTSDLVALHALAEAVGPPDDEDRRLAEVAVAVAMSKDLAADRIRVNAVCIGLIRSAQIERMWQAKAPELSWDEFAADARHGIPLGRIGNAQEAANVIGFLVSEAASFVTGTSVNIDGGISAVL